MNNLSKIPHLPLPVEFQSSKILSEIKNLQLSQYNSWEELKAGLRIDSKWDSIALYSISGKTESDPKEPWTGNFQETDAIKNCPYLKEVLLSLGGGDLLARVERIHPNGSAGWHSHTLESKQPDWISVLELPILMPEDSKFSVLHYEDYRCSDFNKPIHVYEKTYEEGKVYCFNSYHYHNAFNYGDSPMITVRLYVDNRKKKVQNLLNRAINDYNGEYISSIIDA